MQNINTIPKEDVEHLKFYTGETLNDTGHQKTRMEKLLKAERLGNAYQGKVKITFMQHDGEFGRVETTIWATCNNHIVLKGGIIIPINSITDISF